MPAGYGPLVFVGAGRQPAVTRQRIMRRTPPSAARGEQRDPMVRCSVKFDARLILAAVMITAYCMTSSARCRSDGGIVSPRAFAVLRLITSSTLVGCSTGRSAGLAPFRILMS